MKINWVCDSRFENLCKELGITWEYREDIKISELM